MVIDDNAKYWVFAWYILYQAKNQCCNNNSSSGGDGNVYTDANGNQVVTIIETISVQNPFPAVNAFAALPATQ
jgi:hypothetical protein